MTEYALVARGVSKTFHGGVRALDGLDLEVARGSIFGLLGRNGAGKTTAIRVLMGLLRADTGEAYVLGEDLWACDAAHRARVAYVSQSGRLFGNWTLEDHARYLAHFYPRWDGAYARALAKRIEVPWDRRVRTLSGGQSRKVSSILALAAHPEVLLLDEPAAGLDPVARRELIDALIDALTAGETDTVLLSTHIVSDLERIAESVGFIHRGRMLRSDSLDVLKETMRRVQVVFDEGVPEGFSVPGALHSFREGPVITAVAQLRSEEDLVPVRALPGARVNVFPLGLEDIFIELVGRNGADAPELTGTGAREEVTS